MIMKNIRCNNNGCNCTKEEKATNNGNCKHSVIVYTTNSIAQALAEERARVRGIIEKNDLCLYSGDVKSIADLLSSIDKPDKPDKE